MSALAILGLDPGPCTGLVLLAWDAGDLGWPPDAVEAYQCDASSSPDLLVWVLNRMPAHRLGAIEEFREGVRSVRTRNPEDAKVTRALVPTMKLICATYGITLQARPAATVKVWSSDRRMTAAGLWPKVPAKMLDARSAAQVACFCATERAGLPDPLSKKGKGKG